MTQAERNERLFAVFLTVVLVCVHAVMLVSAGALWRDEANSATAAALPTLSILWDKLEFDSFPALWLLTLRAWESCGLGSDLGLRTLGFLAGCLTLAVLWWISRLFELRSPALALGLFGFSVAAVIYGDSVRAYGLGMLTGVLTFGLIWQVVERATPLRVGLALAGALAMVNFVFYGPIYLLAAGLGGMAVSLRRRNFATAAIIAGIGILAGSTYLLYLDMFRNVAVWSDVVKFHINLNWIYDKFNQGATLNGAWGTYVWFGALLIALVMAFLVQSHRLFPNVSQRERDVALFCGVTMGVGVPSYTAFLLHLGYAMQPWYFLIAMIMVAGALDGACHPLSKSGPGRLIRLGATAVLCIASYGPLAAHVQIHKTNINLLAQLVTNDAHPGDLVIINPWYFGVSFSRYYKGSARCTTVPPIADFTLHRYDMVRKELATEDAMRPVLNSARTALQTGHRVYVVGAFQVPPDDAKPIAYVRGHQPGSSWHEEQQQIAWNRQLCTFLVLGGAQHAVSNLETLAQVSSYEYGQVFIFKGWKGPPGL